MPHIQMPDGLPGIVGLLAYKPSTGARLADLIHELLRGASPLSETDRELIAAYVSTQNDDADLRTVAELGPEAEMLDPRLRTLLKLAAAVVAGGSCVTDDLVAAARAAGAGDEEIHDTVLLAAAFCMVSRYAEGLAALSNDDRRDRAGGGMAGRHR